MPKKDLKNFPPAALAKESMKNYVTAIALQVLGSCLVRIICEASDQKKAPISPCSIEMTCALSYNV